MSRLQIIGLLLAIASLPFLACSKNNASHTAVTEQPAVDAPRALPPARPPAEPEVPVAGSVYDVVSPHSSIPPDVLEAMAGFGVKTGQYQLWHTLALDVNGDGARELMLSNVFEWCGSGGCAVWLWQRTRAGLRNLLPTDKILAAAVEVEEERTQGYRNVRIYHRDAGTQDEIQLTCDVYAWNGALYELRSTRRLGPAAQVQLPATAWKVVH